MSKKTVHMIPHTHWDREWYFNTSRSTVYLLKHVKEVIEVLEIDPEFKTYILDAQSSLVEDYLSYHPEDENRIKKLVADKRLYIGPWYTQSDQLVISQESIVRNLLYGSKKAKQLGHSMSIGYVPDAFGQGGNMPQVYRSFGIKNAVFWRGVADSTFPDTQFIWKGTDGSEVTANIMRHGYNFGGEFGIPENTEEQTSYIENFIETLEKESNTDNIYFPYGHDQAPIRENLPALIKDFNELDLYREYIMGDPENFFKELNNNYSKLKVLEGEFTQGKHSRIHKTIFSTRADLKQLNNEIENFIVNTLEPVLVIANELGIDYPHSTVEKIWKLMFENAAHDSIGGCNSDSTNKDILQRYKEAKDISSNLLEITMRSITNKIQFDKELNITTFNPLPYKYTGVIEVQAYVPDLEFSVLDSLSHQEIDYVIEDYQELTEYVLKQTIKIDSSKPIYTPDKVYLVKLKVWVSELPSLGYRSFYINPDNKPQLKNIMEDTDSDLIENNKYQISLNKNNTVRIVDKESKKVYENQLLLIDSGDDGDSYNFSPPRQDLKVSSEDAERVSYKIEKHANLERLQYHLLMALPFDLEERAEKVRSTKMPITVTIELLKDTETINVNLSVENNVLSHKLVVQLDTQIQSAFSYADQIFGPIQRPVELPEMNVWEKEGWDETPISIEPMQSYVALTNETTSYAVITEGVREYEIVGEKFEKIQLTLFRTFSHMGKEDLLFRPGRASGETIVETPDAQLLGKINCTFGINIINENLNQVNLSKISKEYLTIIPSYQNSEFLNGRMIFSQKRQEKCLPKAYSEFELDDTDLGISALKVSEYSGEKVLRIFNPYYDKNIKIPKILRNKPQVELDETTIIETKNELTQNKFITIKLTD